MALAAVSGVIRTFWKTPRAAVSVDVANGDVPVSVSVSLLSKFSNAAAIGPPRPGAAPGVAPFWAVVVPVLDAPAVLPIFDDPSESRRDRPALIPGASWPAGVSPVFEPDRCVRKI